MLSAEIIAIGSELLTPFHSDTNSLWLTEKLNSIGIEVKLKTIVGDDEMRLEETIKDALRRSQIIISTGGLGPTEDDITRKIFSRVLKRPLILNEEILAKIRQLFESRNIPMALNNERQALILRDARVLDNAQGTAPGMLIADADKRIVLLPGPPREMKPIFEQQVMSELAKLSQGLRIRRKVLKVSGMGESTVDDLIAPIYSKYNNPVTTILFTNTEIQIHLTATAASEEEADNLLEELSNKIEEKLGFNVFSVQNESLEEVVARWLSVKRYTIATAESCTGGLLAMRLTSIPGSSNYFVQGVVTYNNQAKTDMLGVPRDLIRTKNAVSAEVAEDMAARIKQRAGATIGVSITGIAGPGGGSSERPVGLVYIGLASDVEVTHKRLQLPGDRERVRWLATTVALDLVRRRYLL
ncbi:MAG: competence/damage-inducible protein A [Acidobacteriota bacterium]